MMSFEDWRDKLLLGMFGLIVPGIAYVVFTTLNSAPKDYVEREIGKALLTSPYMSDKSAIRQSIDDLYRITAKIQLDLEKARENAGIYAEHNYRDIAQIRFELERIKVKHEIYDEAIDNKKKGLGEMDQSGRIPPLPFPEK